MLPVVMAAAVAIPVIMSAPAVSVVMTVPVIMSAPAVSVVMTVPVIMSVIMPASAVIIFFHVIITFGVVTVLV